MAKDDTTENNEDLDFEDDAPENEDEDTSGGKNLRTIDYASKLVGHPGQKYNDLRVRTLGLSLTLLGLAEVQSDRVTKLSKTVVDLEEKVFAEEAMREVSPDTMINLYKMATESLTKSTDYVTNVLATTDWTRLEADLVSIQHRDTVEHTTENADLSKTAEEVLNIIRDMNTNKDKKEKK